MRNNISKKLLMKHPRLMSNFDFDFQNFDFQKMGVWSVNYNIIKANSVYSNMINIVYNISKILKRKEIRFTNAIGLQTIDFNMDDLLESGDKIINKVSKNDKIVNFNMVYCNRGKFMMQGYYKEKKEETRETTIDESFLLGETEVTQELFELVMGYNPSAFKTKHKINPNAQHPVEQVNWYATIEFCNKLSEMYNLKPYYNLRVSNRNTSGVKAIKVAEVQILGGNGYRLPYEKEWEYAAKAGTNNKYAGTNDPNKLWEYAWYGENDNDGSTHPVATKKPNEWGIYDMGGNVAEWCWDTKKPNPKLKNRMMRGGNWRYASSYDYLKDGNGFRREELAGVDATHTMGFRIARNF